MNAIVRDRDGSAWIASQRGLWRQRGVEPPTPVRGGPDIPRGVMALLQDADGALWAPVAGLGLGYLRPDWRQLAQYPVRWTGCRARCTARWLLARGQVLARRVERQRRAPGRGWQHPAA
jgi:ligand-binding sensor domain-containing protein